MSRDGVGPDRAARRRTLPRPCAHVQGSSTCLCVPMLIQTPMPTPMTGQISLLKTLFDALPVGIVVLDRHGDVVVYNREEERLARRSRERVIGRRFFRDVAPCMNVKELGLLFEGKIGREPIDVGIDFSF